jgi:hypothetical protein
MALKLDSENEMNTASTRDVPKLDSLAQQKDYFEVGEDDPIPAELVPCP